jgi:neopullulanase
MRRATSFFVLSFIATLLLGCTSEETGSGTPAQPGFVAHYLSDWAAPHMHFSVQGGAWTEQPGVAMDPEGDGWFVYAHDEGPGVEFVFHNSGDDWDNNGDQNYQTDLPEFWVKDGTIHEAFPDGSTGPWCDEVSCGMGTCNDAEQRCDCDAGYLYDPMGETCVQDSCAGVICGPGELCNPDDGTCLGACIPDRTAGDFTFCTSSTGSGISVVARYDGAASIDAAGSEVRINTAFVDVDDSVYDAASKTFYVTQVGLEPSKYSVLLRPLDDNGGAIEPLFVPMWIGEGMRFSEFSWKDGILYQIMTDRWLNGDLSNDLDNTMGTLAEVDDVRSQWQGGDFRGIIDKIEDGYFTDMGINVLWISSPLLNSHNSQPSVGLNDPRRFASYHSYHPVVTGFRDGDTFGYDQPIETAFGGEAELHELIDKAHARGIRVVPDFVANHVHAEAQMYQDHAEWFFAYNPCDGNWDAHRVDCWFTTDMPDFDYEGNPAAVDAVVDHAIWMIQEYNFDGFRADALKHMSDDFTRALKVAVKERIETTVDNHDLSDEASIFYMVGESLGGWARYHVRADMVQGQVDEDYYLNAKNALLTYQMSVKDLANFAIVNDTAYLTPQSTHFGQMAGYPGAIMGNFFGNHDQWRALTEAGGDHKRLRLAQAFLFTSPGNIPMLYQGDDIGTYGEGDPDNREMMRFDGLSGDEQASLLHAQKLGKVREEHVALRRGTREHVVVEDWYWVFKVSYESDEVYVVLNRDADKIWTPPAGYGDVMGNCQGDNVPSQTACVFVSN